MGDFLKTRPATQPTGLPMQDLSESQFCRDYPYLFEHMTMTVWEGGGGRETSSLTLFFDEGKLKLCLHDRDAGRVAFVAAYSPEEAFRAMEEGLLAGLLDWRPARKEDKRRR